MSRRGLVRPLSVTLVITLGASVAVACTTGEGDTTTGERWAPTPGRQWQWQLNGELDLSVAVPVYDVDGFDTPASTVATLHAEGRRAICYISAGSWEDWRPDADRYPASVLGRGNGWPGERWVDIRRLDVLAPILSARLDMCSAKGFDAVEPDNIDGYSNASGFPLTYDDQLMFNRWLADAAHERDMSIALKNDLEQVPDLVDAFDFAINEQCVAYSECDALRPFAARGKAVLHVEYELSTSQFCPVTGPLGFSSMRKHYDLGAWREPCP